MKKAIHIALSCAIVLALLMAGAKAQAEPLAQLEFDIVGVRLQVDPPHIMMPKEIPTFFNSEFTLPEGAGEKRREWGENVYKIISFKNIK